MAETSILFDGNVSTERFAQMIGDIARNGVVGGAYNNLEPYADSTGMQVKRRSGAAFIGFDNGTVAQRRHYIDNAEKVLAIAGNTSGNPRIDRVVVRLDVNQADPANKVLTIIKQGTPAASPVPPALTRSGGIYELLLAQVAVANAAVTIAAGNVTDERENPAVCGYSNRSNQLRIDNNRHPSQRGIWLSRVAGQTGALLFVDREDGSLLTKTDPDGRTFIDTAVPDGGIALVEGLSQFDGTNQRIGSTVYFKERYTAAPVVTTSSLTAQNDGSTAAVTATLTVFTPQAWGFEWRGSIAGTTRLGRVRFLWSVG